MQIHQSKVVLHLTVESAHEREALDRALLALASGEFGLDCPRFKTVGSTVTLYAWEAARFVAKLMEALHGNGPVDPGTPESRKMWLEGLPSGTTIRDGAGMLCDKAQHQWFTAGEDDQVTAEGLHTWCDEGMYWPATVIKEDE